VTWNPVATDDLAVQAARAVLDISERHPRTRAPDVLRPSFYYPSVNITGYFHERRPFVKVAVGAHGRFRVLAATCALLPFALV
jgi:hypothetical protein